LYWYGGSGANEDVFAAALQPRLIQMASIDIYRWKHDSSGATPRSLWAGKITHLLSQPWMHNPRGGTKPWAVTEWGTDVDHGDVSNARFVTEALDFFRNRGASFAVYFYRVDGNDLSNDFIFDARHEPRTMWRFRMAVDGHDKPWARGRETRPSDSGFSGG
jgi:hypothetical protein